MNGQYLMNKEISVQYAYKKDGKGERHGDQAERMLAAQARKHNVQPTGEPIPAGLFTGGAPSAPAAMLDGDSGRSLNSTPAPYMNGRAGISNGGYQTIPPPQQQRPAPPPQPLPAPPSGLPARPPSQAGYGGPQGFVPPGFQPPPQQGFPSQAAPPPPGFGPPPGFAPPPGQGAPPGLPPGFQQQGYGRGR